MDRQLTILWLTGCDLYIDLRDIRTIVHIVCRKTGAVMTSYCTVDIFKRPSTMRIFVYVGERKNAKNMRSESQIKNFGPFGPRHRYVNLA